MNKLLAAIALSIALPAMAHAADPVPEPKQDCCEKMKAEGKECCCKHMDDKDPDGHRGHAEHDGQQGDKR